MALSGGQVHSGGARNGRIDALRFLAMTAVIAQHCDLMPFGWMGVWLFFVISGFVVASSVLDRSSAQGASSELRKFYARRAARILPAYALLILIAAALQAIRFIELSSGHWSAIILFYYNLFSISHEVWVPNFPLSHLWSISSEMQFYAISGGLLTLLKRRDLVLALSVLALASVFIRLGVSFATYNGLAAWAPNKVNYYNVLCQMDGFCVGALLAISRARIRTGGAVTILAIGLLGLVVYCGVYVGVNHIVLSRSGGAMLHDIVSGSIVGQYREALIYLPIIVVSAGLVALAHIGGLKPLDRLLEVKFLQRGGRSSYSGYLFHFAAVKACMFVVGGVVGLGLGANVAGLIGKSVVFVCALPLTIAVAELSYAWVEKPSARYLARVLRA